MAIIQGAAVSTKSSSAYPNRPELFLAQLPDVTHDKKQIRRVLVANRGEIACRIIATCRKLNIKSLAIYVQEDAKSLHLKNADEAINLGSVDQEGGNPFLNIELLVRTAVNAGADAIHPGYGYLSENAAFADSVRAAGLTFVGPSSTAMSTLGDKRTAKDYLRRHDAEVPLIPGFSGSSQDVQELEDAATKIGYPVMLKASAGGGGRGMRIVHESSKLQAELTSARSEAERSFGSGDCILEKYIEAGKHIEIQILGDSHGNVLSFWERECSVQRRHQKVIEETPSPWLTPGKRLEMSNMAIRIGKLLGYENAGTVEFVVDVVSGKFYFLEVNTRLQVEHPITEEVTGLDIVSLQLFVAAGGNLSSLPILRTIPLHGHAIECRLCAEDPQRGFFPEHGTVNLWQSAIKNIPNLKDVRFETAIETGSQVSIHFDSMIAKVVVWAPTRPMAIEKMLAVLSQTICMGLRTNQLFLRNCLQHPEFSKPNYTTSFIPQNLQSLLSDPYVDNIAGAEQALAIIAPLFLRQIHQYLPAVSARRPFRQIRSGFRNQHLDPVNVQTNIITTTSGGKIQQPVLCQWITDVNSAPGHHKAILTPLLEVPASPEIGSQSTASRITARYNAISNKLRATDLSQSKSHSIRITGCESKLVSTETSNPIRPATWIIATLQVSIEEKKNYTVYLATSDCNTGMSTATQTGESQRVFCHFPHLGCSVEYRCYNMLSYCENLRKEIGGLAAEGTKLKTVAAPMPCKVLAVLKRNGEEVKAGETVMVVESMKMEMNISVVTDGVFEASVRKGDAVEEGQVLCRVN